jgi:hypothetical protein
LGFRRDRTIGSVQKSRLSTLEVDKTKVSKSNTSQEQHGKTLIALKLPPKTDPSGDSLEGGNIRDPLESVQTVEKPPPTAVAVEFIPGDPLSDPHSFTFEGDLEQIPLRSLVIPAHVSPYVIRLRQFIISHTITSDAESPWGSNLGIIVCSNERDIRGL